MATSLNKLGSVRDSIFWVGLGQVGILLGQLGILIPLSNLTDPETVGRWGFAVAIAALVFLISNLGLRQTRAVDVTARYNFATYMRLRLIMCALSIGVIFIIGLFISNDPHFMPVLMVMAVIRATDSIADFLYGHYQVTGHPKMVGLSSIVRGIAGIILFTAALAATADLLWALIAQAAALLASFLFYDLPRAKKYALTFEQSTGDTGQAGDLRAMWGLVVHGIPLGVSAGLIWLQPNLSRFLVEHFNGLDALGHFTVVLYCYTASQMVINAVGLGGVTQLAMHYQANHISRMLRLLGIMILFVGTIGLLAIITVHVAGEQILHIAFGADYASLAGILFVIMIAAALRYIGSTVQFAVTAMEAFRHVMAVQIGVFAIAVIASWIQISNKGIAGAAEAILIINAVHLGLISITFVVLLLSRNKSGNEV